MLLPVSTSSGLESWSVGEGGVVAPFAAFDAGDHHGPDAEFSSGGFEADTACFS